MLCFLFALVMAESPCLPFFKGKHGLSAITSAKRKQSIYLWADVVIEAVPGSTPVAWRFSLSPRGGSGGYSWSFRGTLSSRDVGKEWIYDWKIKVPARAPRGPYILTGSLAIGTQSFQTSSQLIVK